MNRSIKFPLDTSADNGRSRHFTVTYGPSRRQPDDSGFSN
jgi:hypothetical protein